MKTYKESYVRRLQKRRYVSKNRALINQKSLSRRYEYLQSWIGIIPSVTNCQVCDKTIGFMNKENPICFDHRNEGKEPIKTAPNNWLGCHLCTPENIIIWKMCNFGMLCRNCNPYLPTKNRKSFLLSALKYTEHLAQN
jgi:hypothetical protein